jgi:hypothetical protein
MSLLQHPTRALEQIDWYLDNRSHEKFPGTFVLAAGNMARQVLEQLLFIVAFYIGMPRSKFPRPNGELGTVDRVIKALNDKHPTTLLPYHEHARRRGPRIAKFVRHRKSFDRWRKLTNEPSHFANPSAGRRVREKHIREFARRLQATFEDVDGYLVTAAINEIRSGGAVEAVLGPGPSNVPGILVTTVVTPRHLIFNDGRFGLKPSKFSVRVVPNDRELPYRWGKHVVLIQHSWGMTIAMRMKTRSGKLLAPSESMAQTFATFASDPRDLRALVRRLRQLGFRVRPDSTDPEKLIIEPGSLKKAL